MQVVTNAMFASLKVYWYLHTNRLTETQVVTLRMLVSNFQAHLLVLDLVRKKLIKFYTMSSSKTTSKNFVKVSSNSRSSSNSSSASNSSSSTNNFDNTSNVPIVNEFW